MCGSKPKPAPRAPQKSQAEIQAEQAAAQRAKEEEEARKRAEEEAKRIGRSNFRTPLANTLGSTGSVSGLSI